MRSGVLEKDGAKVTFFYFTLHRKVHLKDTDQVSTDIKLPVPCSRRHNILTPLAAHVSYLSSVPVLKPL